MDNQNNVNQNSNGMSRIKSILFNEVTFVLSLAALVGVIISCVFFVIKPDNVMQQDIALMKKDIETIRTNDLVHINKMLEKEYERNSKQDETLKRIEDNQIMILTVLNKK